MEYLIKEAFLHVEEYGPHVDKGMYDLIGPHGEIVMKSVWETVVEPGWSISMHMWPLPEPPPPEEEPPAEEVADIVIVDEGGPPPPPSHGALLPPAVHLVSYADTKQKSSRRRRRNRRILGHLCYGAQDLRRKRMAKPKRSKSIVGYALLLVSHSRHHQGEKWLCGLLD